MRKLTVLLVTALLLAGLAMAKDKTPTPPSGPAPGPHSGEPARIPFASFGNVWDWEAAPDGNGIYLQDRSRNWYFAALLGSCVDLPFAERIGVETWGFDTVDDTSTILVGHDHCRIQQLVHSGPPPRPAKHH